MAATPRVALGATTTARKWQCDVNTSNDPASPNWVGVFGITEFKPLVEGSLQDDSDFDGGGWKSQTNSANAWKNEGKVKRAQKPNTTPPVYDPGQEFLRLASAETGVANSVHCRWYETEPNGPRVEAYEGMAAITWSEDGGNMEALSFASFTMNGQGKRIEIDHPDTVAA
jgi:hypothetical protein